MDNKIEIKCLNNGLRKIYPKGISLLEILEDMKIEMPYSVMGAKVNNRMQSLSHGLYNPRTIEFVDLLESAGQRVYVRSLALLFYKALKDLYPEATFRIEHPISNGYYCVLSGVGEPITVAVIQKIQARMDELVQKNLPFQKLECETESVTKRFAKVGREDIVRLLQSTGNIYSKYYQLSDVFDFFYGALLPSTGYLKVYGIAKYYDGLLIRVPSKSDPTRLEKFDLQDKLFDVFKEHAEWNAIVGVSNVGDLNEGCCNGNARELIKIVEALHERKVASIADRILVHQPNIKVILISGPSSSGKTTFSKRLAIQLKVAGKTPVNLSLDDYFVDREHTPKDAEGNLDFESVYAIDLEFFNEQITDLFDGKEVNMPTFSFAKGERTFNGHKLKLRDNDVLIVEGIHALNPMLTKHLQQDVLFKIYVSALTTISLDEHNWIPTSDNRLIRRIIRDHHYRGYSAKETIERWPSVRKGEEKWIYPYQEEADVMFNSALLFELAVLKNYVEPILHQVPQDCSAHAEAYRLLRFLSYFHPIMANEIPPTSLLREFVGGSSFTY